MNILSPISTEDSLTIHVDELSEIVGALGTASYGDVCMRIIERAVDAEHWALFRHSGSNSIGCVAKGSISRAAVAKANITRFLEGLYRVDPVMLALRKRSLKAPILTNLQIEDIKDSRYRECFELAHARERLSYISTYDDETYFVNAYRGANGNSYSPSEMRHFALLARFIVFTTSKHEALLAAASAIDIPLDLERIDRVLTRLSDRLSKREREVCSLAAVGDTIEQTALALAIRTTSVITYRQRAYKKLGINRQRELIAMISTLQTSRVIRQGKE